MYGIPDANALLRPWGNLKEFTEELYAMLRPVAPRQADAPLVSPRREPQGGVGDVPDQPDLISSDYNATFDSDYHRPRAGAGNQTVMARRPPRYDTESRVKPATYTEWERRARVPNPIDQDRPAAATLDKVSTGQAQPLTEHALAVSPRLPDISGLHHNLETLQSRGKIAGTSFFPGAASVMPVAGSFIAPPPNYTGQLLTPPAVAPVGIQGSPSTYSPNAPNFGSLYHGEFIGGNGVFDGQSRFYSGGFVPPPQVPYASYVPGSNYSLPTPGTPWANPAPFTQGYTPVPLFPSTDIPIAGKAYPYFTPAANPVPPDLPSIPFTPAGGGGATITNGIVQSGTGNEYIVVLYSNGPDNFPDDGPPVKVNIVMIDPKDTIPKGTWLFDILLLQDAAGNPRYYAQPPVWLG